MDISYKYPYFVFIRVLLRLKFKLILRREVKENAKQNKQTNNNNKITKNYKNKKIRFLFHNVYAK